MWVGGIAVYEYMIDGNNCIAYMKLFIFWGGRMVFWFGNYGVDMM